jgi:prepilin-type processing-associated H-X9-DG protein
MAGEATAAASVGSNHRPAVADVVGPTATGKTTWWRDVGTRHAGRLNVVYGDGRVAAVDAAEIDPTSATTHDFSWCPIMDEKLLLSK